MEELSETIFRYLNKRFVGKYYDKGPSGMQILEFKIGPPLVGSANTIYIKYKDLGWVNFEGSDYDGIVEMFALNGTYEIYDSLDELAEARLKKGKKLLR